MIFRKESVSELKHELKKIDKEMSAHTACFTGHRPQKLPWGFNEQDARCDEMKEKAKKEIIKAIKRGYNTFLCGMALGFDIICAEIVLEMKLLYPDIKLIGVLPCRNQSDRWSKEQKERYEKTLSQLDGVRCIYDFYVEGCMQERNQYMINNSSLVIALYNNQAGGTRKTIEYAKKQGLEVVIIDLLV